MLTQPDIRPLAAPWWKPACYRLESDYTATWIGRDGQTRTLTVPAGFQHDGSSEWVSLALSVIPSGLLWLVGISVDGSHRAAALVHDYIYGQKPAGYDRAEADHQFRELALAGGMAKWRADVRWMFLRGLGWIVW